MSRMSNKAGFTIVELIVVVSVLGILLGVVLNTLGEFYNSNTASLATTTQDTDTRSTLRQIDKDVASSTSFTNTSTVVNPLGPAINNTTWTYDPSLNKTVLIATTYATVPTTGMIVYANNTATSCTAPDPNTDTFAKVQYIYFVAPNVRTGQDSLYKRTIVDPNACTTQGISQKTSCAISVSRITYPICQANDAVILDNVQEFKLKFYATPTSTTAVTGTAVNTATTVEISTKTQPPSGTTAPSTATIRIGLSSLSN